jgi:hypothetical protein
MNVEPVQPVKSVYFWRNRLSTFRMSIILFCLTWEFDFTHGNDQHSKLKQITGCIPFTHQSCLTTFHMAPKKYRVIKPNVGMWIHE